jgi:hypothetical protein
MYNMVHERDVFSDVTIDEIRMMLSRKSSQAEACVLVQAQCECKFGA